MISEYKEKMTRQVPYTLTLLMFVEGKQWIRSAGVVGEKERQKKRKKDENGVREGVWSVREKQKEGEDDSNFFGKRTHGN